VDDTGRLVAEGLQGQEGPPGPPGEPGADGGSFPLPPDPYEGALLGWLNGALAWIGTPPVPIPPGLYGPIAAWDSFNGLLTFDNPVDESIGTGVYIEQCFINGDPAAENLEWNINAVWSDLITASGFHASFPKQNAFDGDVETFCLNSGSFTINGLALGDVSELKIYFTNGASDFSTLTARINNGPVLTKYGNSNSFKTDPLIVNDITDLQSIEIGKEDGTYSGLRKLIVNGKTLVDQTGNLVQAHVNQRLSDTELIVVPTNENQFKVGEFIKVQEQRVAPWVLYGNDPTSRIDYLRQIRD
jgi:hypothetical protein